MIAAPFQVEFAPAPWTHNPLRRGSAAMAFPQQVNAIGGREGTVWTPSTAESTFESRYRYSKKPRYTVHGAFVVLGDLVRCKSRA
jgi:hypothetical protein